MEYPEYPEKPDDNNNHDHYIENGFDFVIHGDVGVDKPKDNPCNDKDD
jgi:hypothetical protein